MKIGVNCPVGPLDRYGYQHIYLPVVENLSAFATRIYMCSTTRNRANVDSLLARFPKVEYISSEDTWFDMDSDGNEVFSNKKGEENVNLTLERMRQDGMDCGINICINQYVPERAREPLRQACKDILEAGRPFEWLYKRYQLGNRLFHTDTRLPWILNLQIDNPFVIRADSIHHRDGHERYMIEHGDFRSKDHVAIVDCPVEMTLQDLEDKMEFVSHYSELRPVTGHLRDRDYIAYFTQKFSAKIISNERLDPTGLAIAQNSRSDFVSWIILRHYRQPGMIRRWISFLRQGVKLLRGQA